MADENGQIFLRSLKAVKIRTFDVVFYPQGCSVESK